MINTVSFACRCQSLCFLRVLGCFVGVHIRRSGESVREGEEEKEEASSINLIGRRVCTEDLSLSWSTRGTPECDAKRCGLGSLTVMSSLVFVGVDISCMISMSSVSMATAGCGGRVEDDGWSSAAVLWDVSEILLTLCAFGTISVGSVVLGRVAAIFSSSLSSSISINGDQSPQIGSAIVAAVYWRTVLAAGGAWTSAETVFIRSICVVVGGMHWGAGGAVSTGGFVVIPCVCLLLTCGCCGVSMVADSGLAAAVVVFRSGSFDMMTDRACSSDSG